MSDSFSQRSKPAWSMNKSKGLFSITFALQAAIMTLVVVAVFVTMNDYSSSIKGVQQQMQMQDVGEMVEAKVLQGLRSLQSQSNNVTLRFSLPLLSRDYFVNLSCTPAALGSLLTINVTSQTLGRAQIVQSYVNCSNAFNATGRVFAGTKCVIGNRTNSTFALVSITECP